MTFTVKNFHNFLHSRNWKYHIYTIEPILLKSAFYFEIIINGGNQKDDVDKIVNVYKEVIKTLDSTIMESQINDTVSTYISSQNVSTTFNISDTITVTFYPSVSLSYGNSDCRIEITTTNYN